MNDGDIKRAQLIMGAALTKSPQEGDLCYFYDRKTHEEEIDRYHYRMHNKGHVSKSQNIYSNAIVLIPSELFEARVKKARGEN